MTSKSFVSHGTEYVVYMCPNNASDCKHYTVPADKLDTAVWERVSLLADHITLLEQSIELAIHNKSVEEDIAAVELTLVEWRQKVANYENDLEDTTLRGDTRTGIRNLLNNAHAMVEQLETQQAELAVFTVNRDREREEYDKVLAWCKRVKQEGEEMEYGMKRDFLRLLGAYVLVERLEKRNAMPIWDIKVRLPQVQEIIYKGRIGQLGGPLRRYELRAAHR